MCTKSPVCWQSVTYHRVVALLLRKGRLLSLRLVRTASSTGALQQKVKLCGSTEIRWSKGSYHCKNGPVHVARVRIFLGRVPDPGKCVIVNGDKNETAF